MSPQTSMEHYPEAAVSRLKEIETLVVEESNKHDLGPISQSIKWGQASYQGPHGTPIRLGWEQKTPDVCFIYFHCQTKIISVLREVYGTELEFRGNRAIVLPLDLPLPVKLMGQCIAVALNYRRIKHLPLLGL